MGIASVELIAKLASKYGAQLGKTAKNGTMAFQEVKHAKDGIQKITHVFNSEGKLLKTHEELVNQGGRTITNYTPELRRLSEGRISVGQEGIFGFPLKNLRDRGNFLTAPKIENSFIRYNKFGQKVYDSTNKLTLSATKPEMMIENVTNGVKSERVISTEFMA